MNILGIIGSPGSDCHNSSAALIVDGNVIAAAEQERFSRRKYATGEAPYEAIQFCLNKARISLDEIDAIAISWEPDNVQPILTDNEIRDVMKKLFPKSIFKYKKEVLPCRYVKHHISHLTAAFYQSGYKEAACLVVDGQGEKESITLAYACADKIEIIKTFPISRSLGAFYDAAAGYVGLGYDVPGKFMGLAPYGIPDQEAIIQFDPEKEEFLCKVNEINVEDSFYQTREKYLNYFEKNSYPFLRAEMGKISASEMMSYSNFAASIQKSLDEIILNLAKYLKRVTRSDNLVMSGGVTLNCTSNGYLDRANIFSNIFIYPAANDAGCSVGAALEVARQEGLFGKQLPEKLKTAYLGTEYTTDDIEVVVSNCKYAKKYYGDDRMLAINIAKELADNKVIAWFQGGFEFGPRALGARSILANPGLRENVNKVNIAKERELWRPLSPIVLDSYYKDVFIDNSPYNMSEFMLKTCKISEKWINRIPAVVHVDKTSRPQYLKKKVNSKLYSVLECFREITGIPLLINTSFNIKKQPIINSPREAIIAFESNDKLDGIVIGNWYIYR